MSIYIGEPVEVSDYSAMQGPCAEGFHVPLKSEWVDIKTVWTALGGGSSDGTNFSATLKLPMSGFRRYDNTVRSVGEGVYYWSSTYYDSSEAYYFFINSSTLNPQNTNYRSNGYSIRCIKDTPVTPTASWTKLYGTSIEAGGIFWSSTDGLISMSSNGNTWITIADKNLGATTVWNSGNTLTDANCGKVYQWGNNYGFPGTKSSSSISTSSSQVNVTGYGPGNYYSSSTWITTIPRNNSSNNGNDLWGGVTGVQQKTKSVEVKNIYIGKKPYDGDELCFTANTAGSTVQLTKNGSPTSVTLETSTDGETWNTYTIGSTITLTNIGDKVYWRNTSTSTTGFSLDMSNFYQFVMTGSISGSGDTDYLLNKNSTTTLSNNYCFAKLFYRCSSLTTAPKLSATTLTPYCYAAMFLHCDTLITAPQLPATTLQNNCYESMFQYCSSLETVPALPATTLATRCYNGMFMYCTNLISLPKLPATTLTEWCYRYMFDNCSKIKVSTTQTGEYQTAYRIPSTGNGTVGSDSLYSMFSATGGTFKSTPSINTTYYTSNTVV